MIRCLGLSLLLPFTLVYLYPCPLLAQQQVGGIGGQVRIAGGDFPPHQIVVELRFRGATINSTYADAQGHFAFSELEPDPYRIVINDEAYYPVDESVNLRPAVVQAFRRAVSIPPDFGKSSPAPAFHQSPCPAFPAR